MKKIKKDYAPLFMYRMKNDVLMICIMILLGMIFGIIGFFPYDDTQNENTATFEDLLEFVNQSENNTTVFDAFVYVDNSTGVTYRVYGFDGTIVGMDTLNSTLEDLEREG